YRYIIGLEVDETKPAYKHFYIQPHFNSNLDWVCIKRETAYGEIKIDWRVEHRQAVLNVDVPTNTSATLRIVEDDWSAIDMPEMKLGSGAYEFRFCKNIQK
ncbi:TPA: alpha-L-rhamnosidase C-terminal domain-containing protein, partial [Bacillus cereus]